MEGCINGRSCVTIIIPVVKPHPCVLYKLVELWVLSFFWKTLSCSVLVYLSVKFSCDVRLEPEQDHRKEPGTRRRE